MGVLAEGEVDANWLMIRLQASDGVSTWTSTSPVLEDRDLPPLVDWLHDLVSRADAAETEWGATEPNLHLVARGSGPTREIRVELSQEWRRPGTDLEDDPSVVELSVPLDRIHQFAKEIEAISLSFPVRRGPA